MNIQVIGEHSVDFSLLGKCPANILDIGCRGFDFACRFGGEDVYSIDIDVCDGFRIPYYRLAISDRCGTCGIQRSDDPQATRITEGKEIPMMTIPMFSKMVGVKHWDVIKLDIEGEEIRVLRSLPHPYATQITVEFHAHLGQTKEELDNLLDWLSGWYEIHNRIWEERHGAGYNYWDVLLIRKD